MDRCDVLKLFSAIFAVSSLSGLAALLRSGKVLTVREISSAMLNSGLMAVGIGLIWYHYFPANIYFLMGTSVLAGLGGSSVLDFCLSAIKHGVKVSVQVKEEK